MVQVSDKLALSGPTGNGWVSGRLQDQFGLFKRIALTNVPQELKEAQVPWQIRFTDATNTRR
jgi:hypothetical protein